MKKLYAEISYIEGWFTDQSSKPQEIEDKVYITLIIDYILKHKKSAIQFDLEISYGFLSFAKNMSKNFRLKYKQKLKW